MKKQTIGKYRLRISMGGLYDHEYFNTLEAAKKRKAILHSKYTVQIQQEIDGVYTVL